MLSDATGAHPEDRGTPERLAFLFKWSRVGRNHTFDQAMKFIGRGFPNRGYGGSFNAWLFEDDSKPYSSFGEGSAMRVSPISWAYNSTDRVLDEARKSAEVTHDHPEGINGAQSESAIG